MMHIRQAEGRQGHQMYFKAKPHLPEQTFPVGQEDDHCNYWCAILCSPFLPAVHRDADGITLLNFRYHFVYSLIVSCV